MKSTALPVSLFSLASLAMATSASAQLELVIQADPTLGDRYYPADGEFPPALLITSDAASYPTLDYAGAENGVFTMRYVAPEDMKFVVDPQGQELFLRFLLTYGHPSEAGGLSLSGPPSLSFTGLEGSAPNPFTDSSTMSDALGASLMVHLTMEVTEAFSFTELVYSRAFTGAGADIELNSTTTDPLLFAWNENYLGDEPPLHTPHFRLVAIPEPSAFALVGGLAVAAVALARRRRR